MPEPDKILGYPVRRGTTPAPSSDLRLGTLAEYIGAQCLTCGWFGKKSECSFDGEGKPLCPICWPLGKC